ncbi:583_t:CDS:1 [Scutellospora calospora]|uniref:583_t:CDS:1 n=1 Tax=Scutellospora calospora TaxID=85575 RepID=A0ACA9L7V7_9GLOM|nr:583_t:CDS:1 [Scutellospora calospora]
MGSKKSLRYEVLVYPPKEQSHSTSSNSVSQPLLRTQIQRFTCDRENMQQYWIPEGYHPVLVPRPCLQSCISAANNDNMTTSASVGNSHTLPNNSSNGPSSPLQVRSAAATPNVIIGSDGTINSQSMMKRRRLVKNQIIVPRLSPRSLNAQALYYFQKRRELTMGAVPDHPSKTIGQMWQEEPDSVKRHYERLTLRIKIEQALLARAKQRRHHPYNIDRNNYVTSLTDSSRVARQCPLQRTMLNNSSFNVNGSLNSTNVSSTENISDNMCNALPSSQGFTQSHMLNSNTLPVSSYRNVQNKSADNIVGNDSSSSSDTDDSDRFFSVSHNDFMNADNSYGEQFDSPISSQSSSPKVSATQTSDNNYDIPDTDWMTRSDDDYDNSDAEYDEDDNEGFDY